MGSGSRSKEERRGRVSERTLVVLERTEKGRREWVWRLTDRVHEGERQLVVLLFGHQIRQLLLEVLHLLVSLLLLPSSSSSTFPPRRSSSSRSSVRSSLGPPEILRDGSVNLSLGSTVDFRVSSRSGSSVRDRGSSSGRLSGRSGSLRLSLTVRVGRVGLVALLHGRRGRRSELIRKEGKREGQ